MAEWVKRWGYWVAAKPTRPGVYRMKDGGYLVRGRVTSATGSRPSVTRALRDARTAAEAQRHLDELTEDKRSESDEPANLMPLFSSYATSLLARKLGRERIKSASNRKKWARIIRLHLAPTFGPKRVDEITRADVQSWFESYAERVKADRLPTKKQRDDANALDPQTVNTWASLLKIIMNAAVDEFDLPRNPTRGLEPYSVEQHPTYTDEEPNSLTADEARRFLAGMLWMYPQHYAMTLLGFSTGQRPSHMRPLRRSGPEADVLWKEGAILIRRSHTEQQEVMATTKTGLRQRIALPASLMHILRCHVDSQLVTAEQRKSDLLFPSETGGFRYNSVLDKPFAAVSRAIGLKKRITPRAMRRTYQDLARAASVTDIVTRSISGHQTEAMQRHYSTVAASEQRSGLSRLLDLVGVTAVGENEGEMGGEGR